MTSTPLIWLRRILQGAATNSGTMGESPASGPLPRPPFDGPPGSSAPSTSFPPGSLEETLSAENRALRDLNDKLHTENDLLRGQIATLKTRLIESEAAYASLRFKYYEALRDLQQWERSTGAIHNENKALKEELAEMRKRAGSAATK